MKTPGERIKEKREAAGMTQGQLADRLGVSNTSVAHTEANRSEITLKRLLAYATALGCRVEDLTSDTDTQNVEEHLNIVRDTLKRENLTPNEQLIIDRYRELPQKDKAALLGYILTYEPTSD